MSRRLIPLTIVFLAASCALWGAETPLSYTCNRNPVAPTLDGIVVGDPGWANIPGATGYHTLGDGYTTAKQTTAYATWDDSALYIGVVAEEPDIAQVKNVLSDGSDCWLEDGAEVFVQPPDRQPLQFIVTSGGARASGAGNPGLEGWSAKASRHRDSYSLEIRIGFGVLGVTPKTGDVWHISFCRNTVTDDSGGDRYTCWAPLVSRFLEPESFPSLRFDAKALTATECQAAETTLNADYRATLTAQLAGLAQAADTYLPVLARASESPAFRSQAEPLVAGWKQAVALQRGAATAPLPQVRQALQSAEKLRQQSFELKYTMLLEELFR